MDPPNASRRTTGILVVVILHAVWFYALATGLGRKVIEVLKQPMEAVLIEEVKPPPPENQPPPPPAPKLATPPPAFVPPPEIQIAAPPVVAPTITAVTTAPPVEVPIVRAPPAPAPVVAPPAPRVPVRTAAVVRADSCEKPEYPAASLRAQEAGTVLLNFLIDVDGKVLDSRIERSSRYRKLDEAARKALQLCQFKPATVDGKPEQSWARIEYEWKIE
jgi:protein TonB